jgi:cobalamin synthase
MLMGTVLAVPGILGMLFWMPIQLVAALLTLLVIVPWFNQYVYGKIRGVTSDCLGAICCIAQTIVLLCAAATIRHW